MQTHEIKRKIKNKGKKLVGRGGTRGKTSGRGHKGQKQHGGHGIRPAFRDLIKKLPKLRGHGINRAKSVIGSKVKPVGVNVSDLESLEVSIISPKELVSAGVIRKVGGQHPPVKILGDGEITKKVTVVDCQVSASAKEKIEKAGGSVK